MVRIRSFQISIGFILLMLLLINSDIVASEKLPVMDYSFDETTKTAHIFEDGTEVLSIEQISVSPDLVTMEEVFEVTFHKNMKISDLDIVTNHKKEKGTEDLNQSQTEWFILTNVSYDATENIYGTQPNGTIISGIESTENVTDLWNTAPTSLRYGSSTGQRKWNVSKQNTNFTPDNFTPDWYQLGFDNYAPQTGNDIIVNSTNEIIKTNTYFGWNETTTTPITVKKYQMQWQPLDKKDNNPKKAGDSVTLKVFYHKKAEVGEFKTQTTPSFYGVEIPEMTWWNASWVTVKNNNIPNGTRPFQLSLNISNNPAGLASNATMVNISCLALNCSDLRFTLDNTTALAYWFETNATSSGNVGKVWVNVTGNGTVNMYYGNSAAPWASDGNSTFDFFDDFSGDLSKWTVVGTWSVTNGIVTSTTSNWDYMRPLWGNTTINRTIEIYVKANTRPGGSVLLGLQGVNGYYFDDDSYSGGGLYYFSSLQRESIPAGNWWTLKLTNDGITAKAYRDDVLKFTDVLSTHVNGSWQFGHGTTATAHDMSYDWVRVRRYSAISEPAWVSWSTEQDLRPLISSWSNNATNSNATTITINVSTVIKFNVTADRNIDTWSWFKDGVNQSINFDNFTTFWDTRGVKNITVTAYNATNGTSIAKTWVVNLISTELWWDTAWKNVRDNKLIDGVRPFQMMLNISNNSAGLAGNATYVNISCLALNCSDLRFTLDNSINLSYWFEVNTSNTSTWGRVWVNVTGNGTVNMYYGNSAAPWVNNGDTTFMAFSTGVDYANWTGTSSNVNGELYLQSTGFSASRKTFTAPIYRPFIMEAKFNELSTANPSTSFLWDDGTGTAWGANRNIMVGSNGVNTWWYSTSDNVISSSYTLNTYYIAKESYIGADNYSHQLITANRSGSLGLVTGTAHVTGTELNPVPSVAIASGNAAFVRNDYVSWLFIRSYADPEPVWATWSAETTDDTTLPIYVSSSFTPTQGSVGESTTLSADFADETSISSAIASIQTPNLSSSNYTMSCTPSGTNATCTLSYTDTSASGTYTVLNFYPKDGGGNEAEANPSLTYRVTSVIQPVDIVNGVTAILNTSTPTNTTLDELKANGITTSIITLDWDNITSTTWNNMLPGINYSYSIGMRIALRLNVAGNYNNTPNINRATLNVTTYFPDLKVDPFESDIQWIEFNFTNATATDAERGNFSNKLSQNITEQTNNKFPVYSIQTVTGLDDIYVKVNPLIYLNLMNDADFVSQESITTRGNTTRSRVYSGAVNFTLINQYKTTIMNRLRGTIAGTHPSETYATNVNNGSNGYDIILYNNQSSTQNRVLSGVTGTYLDTTGDVLRQLPTSGTLNFNVSANSFSYITNEAIDRVVLGTSSHLVFSAPVTTNETFIHGSNYYDAYIFAGADTDMKIELFDPTYIKTPLSIVNYAWLNASQLTNYTDYKYVIIADKNAAEINATIAQSLNNTYIYVSVGDYANTDVWLAGKKTEAEWATSRSYNVFIDGVDIGVGGTNFSTRVKELVNHIRVTKGKKVILNTYTVFQEFATFGDVVMKESAFSRWGGDVNAPTYTWEDMDLEQQRANYYNSHNIPVILMSFGAVNDLDKMYFDYMAGAVLYGYNGNNSFRYGQPNFQNQKEIRVPDLGTMLEPGYTTTSTADWNRLYANGRVHIDPVNHTASIDDNKTVNNLSVDIYLYSGGVGTGDKNVTLTVHEPNGTFHNLTYGSETTGVWTWKNIPLSTSDYKSHGIYNVYFDTRATGAGGWNFIGKDNTANTGTHSWYDTSSVNLNATNDSLYTWNSLGNAIQWMVRLNVNYTTANQIDSLNVSRISQTTTKLGANYTINVTGTDEVNASIYAMTETIITSSITNIWFMAMNGSWIAGNIPIGNTTDINASIILDWTYTVIDGYTYGVVTSVIDSTRTLVRFLFPHLSSQEAIVTIQTPQIIDWSNNVTNNDSLTPRLNFSAAIYFFATSDQDILTWEWFRDGVDQSNNLYDFTTSWDTLGEKTINMTASNDNGTSSTKTWVVTVSDITNPWLANESVKAPAIALNASNTLFANFTDDTNISSAIIRLQAPNATESEYAMSCSANGNTSTCSHVTKDTGDYGTYTILHYSITDGSAHTVNISATTSFLVSTSPKIIEWSNTLTQNSTLSDIRANISVSIGFTITTDAIVQYYTWWKDGIVQAGETGQLFTTSWNTLGYKNVSVTATNQFGSSLAKEWVLNVSDVTAPWLTSSSVDSNNFYVIGYPVTINAIFQDDTNISSVKVRIINPDASQANWTMTCGISGSTANCNLIYTTTMAVGTYQIASFYPVDGTGNQRNVTPSLSFTTQPPTTGGTTGDPEPSTGGGGGGGGGGSPVPQPTPVISVSPESLLNFTDIREGATEPMAIDIATCLTDSLVMTNKCSSLNYGIVVEPFNWWVAIGAYIFSLGVITIQSIRLDRKREWLTETLIYGTLTVIISAILVSVGFNVYVMNYLMDSPKYFYTFLNFGIIGAFIALVGDSYYYRKDRKRYNLKTKISILDGIR